MSSYKVSEPSALKFLKANGAVVDENGNVISDSSDYWNKFYDQAEPKPDKILYSDGTIKDSAGNLIQGSTEFNIKKYVQAEPIPAKYLHADGTIDENPGSDSGYYAWVSKNDSTTDVKYYNFTKAPHDYTMMLSALQLYITNGLIEPISIALSDYTYVSDSEFILYNGPDVFRYTRESSKDFIS